MVDEIPVTEARAQLSDLVNRVGFGKERIVLTRHGRPLVALIPAEDLAEQDDTPATGATPLRTGPSPTGGRRTSYLDVAARAADPPAGPLHGR